MSSTLPPDATGSSASLADAASTLMSGASSALSASATTTTTMDAAASSASLASFLAAQSSILESAASASKAATSAIATANGEPAPVTHPASYKIIGLVLAIASGLFIGSSFVFKKKGLISAQKKPGFVKGEGHAYLKSPMWWTGMIIMIIGEVCNFVAYAFTEAILVTPMGALSVVICAVLSSIFLKERLTFFGKIGCALCVLGAVIIAVNAPSESSAATIPAFQALFVTPWFLAYTSVVVVVCAGLIFWAAPRYGKKNMLVYIAICSLIGGLSVVCTSGLGSSILTSINGNNQFKHWFMYFLMGFVVVTLLMEINYLNKALELFNTAGVTTTYYVTFTFATLVTDIVLKKGFKASPSQIVSVVFGFFTICCGITLLQMSKVDPEDIANGKSTGIPSLDRKSTILLAASKRQDTVGNDGHKGDLEKSQYDDENGDHLGDDGRNLDLEDPGVDTIRGFAGLAGSVHRALSARRTISRRKSHMSQMSGRSRYTTGYSDEGYTIDEDGQIVIKERRWRKKNRGGRTGALPGNDMRETEEDDGITRHQLYDAPMPSDAMDRVSHYSKSPTGAEFPPSSASAARAIRGEKIRSPTTIGFDEDVVEHRYPGAGERGPVLHQAHGVHRDTYPHSLPLHHHTQSEMSDFGAPSSSSFVSRGGVVDGDSILDTANATTPRPAPAHRGISSNLARSDSTTSGGSGSTATGGSVVRGENRSLSQMITEHFVAHGGGAAGSASSRRSGAGRAGGLNIDTSSSSAPAAAGSSGMAQSRSNASASSSKSPTGRNFFSSITTAAAKHRGHQAGDADADQEEEERMGLVGHSAQFAGSAHGHDMRGGWHRASDSRASSRLSGSDTESLDGQLSRSRFRDNDDDDDDDGSYPRRRL